MGTVVSSFPSFVYPQYELNSLHDTFQQALYRGARARDIAEQEIKYGLKYDNVSEAVRKASTMKYNLQKDHEPEQIPTIPEEEPYLVGSKSSKETFQPSRSRLPTPINRSRRASQTSSVNNNENNMNDLQDASIPLPQPEAEPSKVISDKKDSSFGRHKSDLSNLNTERPFHPESWPTTELILEHLRKLESQPTSILFARFASRTSKNFIEIKYSVNKHTGETAFECSDKLDNLISSKEGYVVGESQQEQIEYFLIIFKTCINLLPGQVWWNGYSLIFDQNAIKNRLKVSAFEIEPSQLLFELPNVKDLEVHRSGHKFELRSKMENGSPEEFKYFRIRGLSVKELKVSKLRGTLVTVHVPEFTTSMLANTS